jgi:hypothetical protein
MVSHGPLFQGCSHALTVPNSSCSQGRMGVSSPPRCVTFLIIYCPAKLLNASTTFWAYRRQSYYKGRRMIALFILLLHWKMHAAQCWRCNGLTKVLYSSKAELAREWIILFSGPLAHMWLLRPELSLAGLHTKQPPAGTSPLLVEIVYFSGRKWKLLSTLAAFRVTIGSTGDQHRCAVLARANVRHRYFI